MNSKSLDALLKFDPLDSAEKITGASYKEDQATGLFGLGLAMAQNRIKRQELSECGDSYQGMPLTEYLEVIEDFGFERVLYLPFRKYEAEDALYIYWEPERGILLSFDSYNGNRVNGGRFYYNWIPNETMSHRVTSSGGFYKIGEDQYIWSGYHDCREAIRHHVKQLESAGSFIVPWLKLDSCIWLFHYGETEGLRDFTELRTARLAALPEHIRIGIGAK